MNRNRVLAALVALVFCPALAAGERVRSIDGSHGPATELRASAPPPLRLAERPGAVALASLRPAAEAAAEELEAVASWNRARRTPARNGFARPLPEPQAVELDSGLAGRGRADAGGLIERRADGALVWGTEVRVEGAWRLRLHLSRVELPADALMWVYGAGGKATGPFGLELRAPAGDLWTPSVGGEAIRLEILLPPGSGSGRFVVDRVGELFRLGADGAPLSGPALAPRGVDTSCLVDAQCVGAGTFPPIENVQKGIGHLHFVDGVSDVFFFICSGGLLNDATSSLIPYLLTANHCFHEQVSASSVEVFWDDVSPVCDGAPPDLDSLPKSNGGVLLGSSAVSDHTLMRLNGVPAGRFFLGWNANPVAHNTVLNRISHPDDLNQHYSRNHVDANFAASGCQNFLPRPKFLYETYLPLMGDQGGTFGGSSGAPVMLNNGQVVGQLLGACGIDPSEGCDYDNREIDGAFSQTFDAGIGGILNDFIALQGGRFEVDMTWRGPSPPNNVTRPARVGPGATDFAGNFYFLNPRNSEALIKVINGCSVNNRFWVFAAATTNVEYTITVTDTQSQQVKTYFNPLGNPAAPIQDTSAFATCP